MKDNTTTMNPLSKSTTNPVQEASEVIEEEDNIGQEEAKAIIHITETTPIGRTQITPTLAMDS